jgi:PhoH-like ATPase
MKKTFVLDTNVLLHDPKAIFKFKDNDIILPITIVEELDRFKKLSEMTGRNARQVSRTLDELRTKGRLTEGISLDNGGSLKVILCDRDTLKQLPSLLDGKENDNAILAVALEQKANCQCQVVLVSKDTNLRIKADALGLEVQDYENDKIDFEGLYTGETEVLVESEAIDELFKQHSLNLDRDLYPNQALVLVDVNNASHTALGIVNGSKQVLPLSKAANMGVSRIHPRNREQKFALELLLRDEIALVTLVGKAGTGKTLLAIAAGLAKTIDEKVYTRLLISRPVVPMGKDLGYLPGDIKEKLTPWMQPLYDNFDLIFTNQDPSGKPNY